MELDLSRLVSDHSSKNAVLVEAVGLDSRELVAAVPAMEAAPYANLVPTSQSRALGTPCARLVNHVHPGLPELDAMEDLPESASHALRASTSSALARGIPFAQNAKPAPRARLVKVAKVEAQASVRTVSLAHSNLLSVLGTLSALR